MSPCQRPQFIWQGKRCHVIENRQQFACMPIDPPDGIIILAFRATSMPAGQWSPFSMPAAWALHKKFTGISCPATANGIHCIQMTRQDGMAVLVHKCVAILIDNGSQFHDHTILKSTCRVLIRALIVVRLSFSATSVGWA